MVAFGKVGLVIRFSIGGWDRDKYSLQDPTSSNPIQLNSAFFIEEGAVLGFGSIPGRTM